MKKIFILSIAIYLLSSCTQKTDPSKENTNPEIPVLAVKKTNTTLQNRVVARIEAQRNVEIRSRIKGYIENILVDEGQTVHAGQPLFKLSSPDITAEYNKMEALLTKAIAEEKSAKLEVSRTEMLVQKNIVAKTELVLAESKHQISLAALAEAKSGLKNAKAFLNYTSIDAPFDGVINRIPHKTGSLIADGDLLTSISDISNIYTYFNIAESDYLKFLKARKKGNDTHNDIIRLITADGSEYPYKGIVQTVASEIDGSTGSITFRAKFTNPDKLLKHGASGTVILEKEANDIIIIPQKSIMEIQDKNYVFIVDATNKVRLRSVQIGSRVNKQFIIESGINAGEKVVAEGVALLKEGDSITPTTYVEDEK